MKDGPASALPVVPDPGLLLRHHRVGSSCGCGGRSGGASLWEFRGAEPPFLQGGARFDISGGRLGIRCDGRRPAGKRHVFDYRRVRLFMPLSGSGDGSRLAPPLPALPSAAHSLLWERPSLLCHSAEDHIADDERDGVRLRVRIFVVGPPHSDRVDDAFGDDVDRVAVVVGRGVDVHGRHRLSAVGVGDGRDRGVKS